MFAQLFKLRVAVLWVSVAVSMAAAWLLGLITPGTLDEMIEGRLDDMAMSDGLAFMMSTYFVVPLVMAGLTLVLSDRLSSYGNLVIGGLIGLFLVLGVVAEAVVLGFDAHLLVSAIGGVFALMIAAMSLTEVRRQSSAERGAAPAESEKVHVGAH